MYYAYIISFHSGVRDAVRSMPAVLAACIVLATKIRQPQGKNRRARTSTTSHMRCFQPNHIYISIDSYIYTRTCTISVHLDNTIKKYIYVVQGLWFKFFVRIRCCFNVYIYVLNMCECDCGNVWFTRLLAYWHTTHTRAFCFSREYPTRVYATRVCVCVSMYVYLCSEWHAMGGHKRFLRCQRGSGAGGNGSVLP